mmetsp:Transcript_29800/g.30949  ORF Transcript_29800/g.30949 Transcript_29800/m.30949 type:complete len:104 (+) Transcript_29800:1-312(+)
MSDMSSNYIYEEPFNNSVNTKELDNYGNEMIITVQDDDDLKEYPSSSNKKSNLRKNTEEEKSGKPLVRVSNKDDFLNFEYDEGEISGNKFYEKKEKKQHLSTI